jgi:hypothetical protein
LRVLFPRQFIDATKGYTPTRARGNPLFLKKRPRTVSFVYENCPTRLETRDPKQAARPFSTYRSYSVLMRYYSAIRAMRLVGGAFTRACDCVAAPSGRITPPRLAPGLTPCRSKVVMSYLGKVEMSY